MRFSWGGGGTRTSSFEPPSARMIFTRSGQEMSPSVTSAIRDSVVYMSPLSSMWPDTYARASPSAPGAWARYATATGERTSTTISDPICPARLPS